MVPFRNTSNFCPNGWKKERSDTPFRLAEAYLHVGLPADAGALLIMEVDGKRQEIDDVARSLEEMSRRLGADTVTVAGTEALMQRIKQAFDPLGLLNPGKIFPESVE